MLKYTKEELAELHRQGLNRLIEDAGDMAHLALMLDMPFSTIQGWHRRGRISKFGVRCVLRHPRFGQKFTVHDFRPEYNYHPEK